MHCTVHLHAIFDFSNYFLRDLWLSVKLMHLSMSSWGWGGEGAGEGRRRGIGRDFDQSLRPGGRAFELSCCPGGRDI